MKTSVKIKKEIKLSFENILDLYFFHSEWFANPSLWKKLQQN
jgi:hypothetical protein